MGEPRATAVIAAAGSGERLGAGGPKALVPLAGRPMIEWSLLAAAAARTVEEIVVAAPPGHERECERRLALAAPAVARTAVVTGGETRAESVRAALAACGHELVLVHDAARPLAGAELFDAVCERLASHEDAAAVIAAAPIADTVKRARDPGRRAAEPPRVEATLDRELLWAAQTPQGFRSAELQEAQRRAEAGRTLQGATDEATLIELAGGVVLLEPAPAENLKVTTPADLAVATALLEARARV